MGFHKHSNDHSCSIQAAKFFSNSEVIILSKVNLFHEVINGNNRRVNDIPTAARKSYPVETYTLGLEKIT
jgi:hypothetical protein